MTSETAKPKRWKLLIISFLFVYPVLNILFFVAGDLLSTIPQLLRTLIMSSILVPLFGYCIPYLHKKFWSWAIK